MKVLKFCCQFSFFQKLDFNHVEENNKIKDTVNKKHWKQQTTGSYNVHWWLSHQRPVGWGFIVKRGSKVRTPSLKAVQPIQCQPPAWQWKWKQSGMMDCLKRWHWQSDHTSHHPHRFNELATKSQMWNENPAIVQELCESPGGHPGLSVLTSLLISVDVKLCWTMLMHWSQLVPNMSTNIRGHQTSPEGMRSQSGVCHCSTSTFKDSCGFTPWTWQSQGKWPSR